MPEFAVPKTDTKSFVGPVTLTYAFKLEAEFDRMREEKTPRGARVFQQIASGVVSGPKLAGKVYPYSGSDLGFLRPDRVEDLNLRFMINTDDGEWIYVNHSGYHRRTDGYYRVAATFDAERTGAHFWLNDTMVVATAEPSKDGRRVVFTYYEVG